MSVIPSIIPVVAGVFHRYEKKSGLGPEVLVFQRASHDAGGGFFEFPGGKVEAGESEKEALIRELQEEISIEVNVHEVLGSAQFHGKNDRTYELKVYFVEGPVKDIFLREHQQMKWISRSTLDLKEIAVGDRPLMESCFQKLDQLYGHS